MKALMLDVDGVLINGASHWTKNLQKTLGVSPHDLRKLFFDKHWHKIIIGQTDIEPLLALALEQMRAPVTAEDLIEFWFSEDAQIDETVLSDVNSIRNSGIQVHLTTNQEHRRADFLMTALGLNAHVDGIQYSAKLGARKPNQGFFKAAQQPGFEPKDHLLVDDTPDNVTAARKAGWAAHHWETGHSLLKVVALNHSIS